MSVSLSVLMESSPSPILLCPSIEARDEKSVLFDASKFQKQSNLPTEFMWPRGDVVQTQEEELNEPLIDLEGFVKGDDKVTAHAVELVRTACSKHGFFQVTNHGVDSKLIQAAYQEIDGVFKLPMNKKLSFKRKDGGFSGYSAAHADRFSTKLPWKETFSFGYRGLHSDPSVVHYFRSALGKDFEHTGNSGLILGTGPHCDPTSLTILHQDQVGGLEVFTDNKWHAVRPRQDSLVVNLGDTFMALCNGRYKSCLHRAVVNRERERRSLVYFVCPKEDKVVRPPQDLMYRWGETREYPDFTWSDLLDFTQNHYRADVATLQSFFRWLPSSSF
ncbi:UDP-Glycosyltransferase superfamily protein [Hibiscus syriacus]|uniref:UDP-Glycosyltransferase superfamily protein n=1 Tax=Hibiscus syriacus TaxID=106335 RepID=A0A6A3BYK3_HIBSY|nr:UDP-Glycosyltransferase superfamily protein [Hibiscus syriacus]